MRQGGFRPAEGYYLEVVDERKPIQEAGDYHALYYAERMRLSSSLRYISDELGSILEQYFSVSPHKRTIAYLEDDGRVRPVFEMEKGGDTRDLMTCHDGDRRFVYPFIHEELFIPAFTRNTCACDPNRSLISANDLYILI